MHVNVYVTDLFLWAKIDDILKHIENMTYRRVDTPDLGCDFLIADLEKQGTLDAVAERPAQVICFCSHIQLALMNKAKLLGCTQVYTKGLFFTELPEIIAELSE